MSVIKQVVVPNNLSDSYFDKGVNTTNKIEYKLQYTIASLKATSGTNIPPLVYITDTGKEGWFRYDSTDLSTTNDDSITIVSGSKRYKRDYTGAIKAKWFGYDPKSQTGNAENAIKNAVLAASLIGGVDAKKTDVIIDEGVWNYAGTTSIIVPNNVRIKGISKTRTSIYITSPSSVSLFNFTNTGTVTFDNCIEDITIKNSSNTISHTAITLTDVSHCSVKNVIIGSDTNSGYFKGTGLNINGRELILVQETRIYADKPIVVNTNPNHSISIDQTTFRDILLASPAVSGNKLIEISTGVNLTNVNLEGSISFNGGQYGLYWNDTTTVGAGLNFNIHNIRHEQEIAGGYTIYINHNTGLKNLILENVSGGLSSGFLYTRKVEKITLVNCLHYGTTTSINSIATDANYNISAINFFKNGTLNLTGYNLNKFGNDNYFWTYTDKNILSNNVITNSNGIGVNAIPTITLPNIITTPLIGDYTNGLMLGSLGTGTLNRSINVIFNDFVDLNGTYNVVLTGERENIGADWQGSFRIRLNTLSAPNSTISTLTDMMVFNGRLRTLFIKDKINSDFYKSTTARSLTTPIGLLNFDATGAIGTQSIGQTLNYTTAQINALTDINAGLHVFNSTLSLPVYYNGTAWKRYDNSAM